MECMMSLTLNTADEKSSKGFGMAAAAVKIKELITVVKIKMQQKPHLVYREGAYVPAVICLPIWLL